MRSKKLAVFMAIILGVMGSCSQVQTAVLAENDQCDHVESRFENGGGSIGSDKAVSYDSALLKLENDVCEVSNSAELEQALEAGYRNIQVVQDFVIDRTFYITDETRIYSTRPHVLTRSKNFTKDFFVVGEDKNGRNVLLDEKKAVLEFGSSDYTDDGLLVIDGNKDMMEEAVSGSIFFICNSGYVDIYKGIKILGCKKELNEKTKEDKYKLPYPDKIGGSVAVVANGTLNIYGGEFEDNSVNFEQGENDSNCISSLGGVFYNFSSLNILDGKFFDNCAARGGVIYNYRMAMIDGGSFRNNSAQKYGGVIYQAGSQFGQLMIGYNEDRLSSTLDFEGNHADSSGGVVFSQTKNAVVISGNTVFKDNYAENNGGAITISGTLTVHRAKFESNTAKSKGGAIFVINSEENLKTRFARIDNGTFIGNKAERGGAIGIMAEEELFKEGGKVFLSNCRFEKNEAVNISGNEEGDYHGGAIYLIRKSELTVDESSFVENKAEHEGGAIYGSSESSINIESSIFQENKTVSENDGCGGGISVHSSALGIAGSSFERNYAGKNAGALYISYVGTSEFDS